MKPLSRNTEPFPPTGNSPSLALFVVIVVLVLGVHLGFAHNMLAEMPSIVVFLTDDQGYADIGLNDQHPREVLTPNMDALALDGVFFRQAYTSGHVCSPTRRG